ncbi:A24 family peptidase [uncultured Thiodictyon sp.]|uniref:A24 family peptidase n=1 Tax=uncultured Thiodictyon sp. TaxID=1846217 RepID=UPI0025E4C304|nr:A24 family peptidase [uncultured Thiodictyon sp.]
MTSPQPLMVLVPLLVLVWAAAWVDFHTFKVPNALSVSGALLGLLVQAISAGIDGLGAGLAGLGLAMVLFFPLYLIGRTGAGDVKLIGALGTFLGPERLFYALLPIIVAAGAVAVIYAVMAWRTRGATGPWQRYGRIIRFLWVTGRFQYLPPTSDEALAARLPLAVPIALGSTAAVLWPFSIP